MAVYKVPQDVEADDKLIGPFNFRQFVYLLISAGLIAAAVGLAQLFPVLAIIPLPPVLLLLALALPLKKDQPMETYLAALVSFYLKPRERVWMPGQKENTIVITAPKIVEDTRTKDITEAEATHRLSFLADVVDTQGQAIKNPMNIVRDDLVAEADTAVDIFDKRHLENLQRTVQEDELSRHRDALLDMQKTIEETEKSRAIERKLSEHEEAVKKREREESERQEKLKAREAEQREREAEEERLAERFRDLKPTQETGKTAAEPSSVTEIKSTTSPSRSRATDESQLVEPFAPPTDTEKPFDDLKDAPKSSIIELANDPDLSIATIAKEANRIKKKEKNEIFISLH